MNKLLVCVVLALMVLQCVVSQLDGKGPEASEPEVTVTKSAKLDPSTKGSASAMVPTPLLQLGMTVVPALLYKLL